MSRQSVKWALEAMDDPEVRARLAEASPLVQAEFDLSNDEIEMVSAAAADYPEVEGFSFQTFLDHSALNPLGPPHGPTDPDIIRKIPGRLKWSDITLRRATSSEPEVMGFAAVRHDPYKNFNFRLVVNSKEIPVADAYLNAYLYTNRDGFEMG